MIDVAAVEFLDHIRRVEVYEADLAVIVLLVVARVTLKLHFLDAVYLFFGK